MSATEPSYDRTQFLPAAEAAERLGVSRLKVREAISKGVLPARRDNEGRWRVDIDVSVGDLNAALDGLEAQPADLIGGLFDEIEELYELLAGKSEDVERLSALVERQQQALEKTVAALESAQADTERLAVLFERALDLADALEAVSGNEALEDVSARAFDLLETTSRELVQSRGETLQLSQLLGRAVSLAETVEKSSETKITELNSTTEKAMILLDKTVENLEQSKSETARLAALLDRSMQVSAVLEADLDERGKIITAQEQTVDRLFSLAEKTAGLAGKIQNYQSSFWARFLGRMRGT